MDITVRSEGPWLPEDRSWLGSAHGTTATKTITLDPTLFTANTHYPNGYIPSGTLLGEVTASPGVYGPYDNAAGDGRTVAAGLLFNSTPIRTGQTTKVGAPLLEHGIVRVSKLPTNSGIDANGRTDLAGRIIFRA
jgi:hypothetical protein